MTGGVEIERHLPPPPREAKWLAPALVHNKRKSRAAYRLVAVYVLVIVVEAGILCKCTTKATDCRRSQRGNNNTASGGVLWCNCSGLTRWHVIICRCSSIPVYTGFGSEKLERHQCINAMKNNIYIFFILFEITQIRNRMKKSSLQHFW